MRSLRPSLVVLSSLAAALPAAAISIAQFNTPIVENFDTLAGSGTSSSLPAGWSFAESGTGADGIYAAGTGASTTGNTYSFGASGAAERALGTLLTSSLVSTIGVSFANDTAGTIDQLAISFEGEQWRLGATGRTDRLDFAYSLDGTTWTEVDALDLLGANSAGTAGALDGNAAANRVTIAYTITGLSISPSGSVFLRWSDFNAAGSDDGLAIDNFSLTAGQAGLPPPVSPVPDELPIGLIAALLAGVLALRVLPLRALRD